MSTTSKKSQTPRDTAIDIDRNESPAAKEDFYCFFGTIHVSVITAFKAVLDFWMYGGLFPYLLLFQFALPFGLHSVYMVFYFSFARVISIILVVVAFGCGNADLLVPYGILQAVEVAIYAYLALLMIINASEDTPGFTDMGFFGRFSLRTEMTVKMILILAVLAWAVWISVRCYRYIRNVPKNEGISDSTSISMADLEDDREWLSLYGRFHITTLTRILTTLSSVLLVSFYISSNDASVSLGSILGFTISIQVATTVVIFLGLNKGEYGLMKPFMVAQIFGIVYNVYHLLAVAMPNVSIFMLVLAIAVQAWAVRTVQKCDQYFKACSLIVA
ncbi:hypothetical protein L596_009765 [Steinernema carpocapsae]|uniref:Uncharacterized protein n=1 Tax=Steinernema carpocapsae TaxID=34508 RepID=A0A4U5PHM2_STECR|nr:hypothetical protein L596_009765 [Steinernema carpocapsae]